MSSKITVLFMAAAPDDKIYVNVVKEGTEIQQTLDGQRDKFQFFHSLGITKDHFLDDLERYRPNILHFSGHGTEYSSLVFQDGDELSSEQLEKTFQSLPFKISVVFLNACYSKQQARSISKYVDYIIGMKKAVSDEAAIIFSSKFYKSLLKNINYKEAYNDAIAYLSYYLESESSIPKLIVAHGFDSSNKISESTIDEPVKLSEEKDEIVIQNLPVSADLLTQIEKSIRIYDEKSITEKFKFQKFWQNENDGNLSGILIILNNNSSEYGVDDDQLHLIRNTLRKIPQIINKSEEYRDLINGYCNDIINQVLRKIYFNYKVDSIEKIQPLLPKTSISYQNNETLSKIMDTYYYLYKLKEQIEYSIVNYNNELFLIHSITQCYSILHIFNIRYHTLIQAFKFISEISTNSYLSIQSLVSDLETSLENFSNISDLQKSKNIILQIEKTTNELFASFIQFIHLFMS
ncbi:MAG TPA: CHAT domain-containing protein [Nitrososphaeraceae archaeon]|nr:CHAT domain-containing protein [Nitrososphaeraceae archaeon]